MLYRWNEIRKILDQTRNCEFIVGEEVRTSGILHQRKPSVPVWTSVALETSPFSRQHQPSIIEQTSSTPPPRKNTESSIFWQVQSGSTFADLKAWLPRSIGERGGDTVRGRADWNLCLLARPFLHSRILRCKASPIRKTCGSGSSRTMAPSRWRILEGKTAAITGGTTGIGRAIALEYLRQGCNVAINHLGLEKDEVHKNSLLKEAAVLKAEKVEGESTSKAGDLLEVIGDVTKAETGELLVQKAVEKWGKLDIFVANAGIFQAADFLT